MLCPFCGKENLDAASFCAFCGKPVKAAPAAAVPLSETVNQSRQ